MSELVLGIDPGLSGALAFYGVGDPLDSSADHFVVFDIPTNIIGKKKKKRVINDVLLANIIAKFKPKLALVEKVTAMQGWGISTTWSFAQSFGTILGVLGALKIPKDTVTPKKWKAHFDLIGTDKHASLRLVRERWPASQTLFARIKDHNRAEAALIAAYAKQKIKELI